MMCSLLIDKKLSLSGTSYKLEEEFFKSAYRKFTRSTDHYQRTRKTKDPSFGAVYNVEFTPYNSNTVIACYANKAVALFDARMESMVHSVPTAHDDGVNVVSFLDPVLFATGSDDEMIKIWDLRMLTAKSVAVLKGHEGWVKNIEMDHGSNSLFSIAFNDGVRKWDINRLDSYENGEVNNIMFDISDAVRLRISPDSSTMVVSFRKDHLLVLSNFDGNTLDEIKSILPQSFPLNKSEQQHMNEAFHQCSKNTPSVHVVSGLSKEKYRTPLSIAYHPSSRFLAMRVVDVQYSTLAQELTLLYDIKSKTKPYQDMHETGRNFLKYVDEDSPDSVIDFIKEISFSKPDGRVLVSPCGNSVRLLAVDCLCTPMDLFYDCRYSSPEKELNCIDFEQFTVCDGHKDGVLTSRLNSDNMCLVSGCVDGNVMFSWPKL